MHVWSCLEVPINRLMSTRRPDLPLTSTRDYLRTQVMDVVNYILNSWGNKGGTVTIEEVANARDAVIE